MSMGKLAEDEAGDKDPEGFKEEDLLIASGKFRNECIERFQHLAKVKFDNGQKEHGGYLPIDVSITDLEDEVIDQWFYLQAVKAKLHALCPKEERKFYEQRADKTGDMGQDNA